MFEQIRAIYTHNFPPTERVKFLNLVKSIQNRSRWLYTAKYFDQNIGFAILIHLQNSDIYLLEYLAVARSFQNRGIGSLLFNNIVASLESIKDTSGIILEVDTDIQGTDDEKKIRRRRIRFYCRNGANIVECASKYRIPNMVGKEPLCMKLMWLPLNDRDHNILLGKKLKDSICDIFVQSYGLSVNAPLLQEVLLDLDC